jgi:outer membrane lipoprotein LolB
MTPGVARTAALVAVIAAGCATGPRVEPAHAPTAKVRDAFEVVGRFSARRGEEGAAGQFAWTHDPLRDAIVFSAPTGQSIARLAGDAGGVRLDLPDGRTESAHDWERLTERALGVPIPVRGLAYWVQSVPRPGAAHDEERSADGRMSVLRQDGWEIVYAYRESPAPSRLVMRYPPDVELRLVLDEWR